jgi:predicted Zn-ribbon and HTH transcriptional regulator
MIRLICFLWSGCLHVWDDAGDVRTVNDGDGVRYFMQPMKCQKCGARKRAKV